MPCLSNFGTIRILSVVLVLTFLCSPGFCVDKATSLRIAHLIEKHKKDILDIRRFIHMNPELSNREFDTSKLVSSKLLSLNMEVKPGVAHTGVVGLLRGQNQGITIGVRADMDALPIEEQTGLPYQSLNQGIMHACGHDVHTSIVLGTAMVLNEMRDLIKGSVKFIFQPAEEGVPAGEQGGASLMIKQGVLDNPPVRAILGLHVWPDAETGTILFSSGTIFAGADTFDITIQGKSAHGARPHEGIDAVYIASQVVIDIQSIISRSMNPVHPAVVTIGKISGGSRPNILADQVKLEGTVRTLDQNTQQKIKKFMEKILISKTQPFDASYSFSYKEGTSPLYNHPDLGSILEPSLKNAVGDNNVHSLDPQMVAEDFSEYSERIPGFYFLLGVKPPWQNTAPPLHSSRFSPDENSIPIGIKTLCHLLLDCLDYQKQFEDNNP
ncbi:MAG: amidohydrolase [Candidatus Aminicenantes bacterium]|nr:amidohydrolase [Candidatus Aminicenantes bacterium]